MKKPTTPPNRAGNTYFARRCVAQRKATELRSTRKRERASLRSWCGRAAMVLKTSI